MSKFASEKKIHLKKFLKFVLHSFYFLSLIGLIYLMKIKYFADKGLIISLIIINLPYIFYIWSFVFNDFKDFKSAIRYSFRWDVISFFKGELEKDWHAERGLKIFYYSIVIIVAVEYMLINILKYEL